MLLLKLVTILLTAIDVQVDLLDGTSQSGTLISLDAETIVLQSEGTAQTIPLTDVVGVSNSAEAPDPEESSGHVLLHDGSQINGRLKDIAAKDVKAESAIVGEILAPRTTVRAILLSAPNSSWETQWDEFLERDNQGDMLILKKRDGSGLDFYSGVISATAEDHVDFVLDGDTVPVPRNRIYGLLFEQNTKASSEAIAVQLADDSQLAARRLKLDGEVLTVETSWKQTLQVPLSHVRGIDFSSGRFHYLSDLDPVKESYFGIHPKGSALAELLKADDVLGPEALNLWKLHRDRVPMGPRGPLPLTLRGRIYKKGVWLFPHCRIDYALDGKYSTFQTIAGVDDEVAFNCSTPDQPSKVQLTFLTDGDEVWKQLIDAPADPLKINLDVSGVQTLSIEVNFGDDDSACDFLDLADARLLVVP